MIHVHVVSASSDAPPRGELIERESEAVRGLYMSGLLRQIWVHADRSGALMIAEATSSDDVMNGIRALPMIRAGYLHVDAAIPLAPYWGFGPRS